MNIIEAVKQLKPGWKLVSEHGFSAMLHEDDRMLVCVGEPEEPFGFYPEELLSEKWTIEEGE